MEVDIMGKIVVREREAGDIYRPSCDKLLSSVGRVYREKSVGLVLTGMGSDGAKGVACVKENGGVTLAQDEESSVIYGMPKVAAESGSVDKILHLREFGPYLARMAKKEWRPQEKIEQGNLKNALKEGQWR